MYPTLRKSAHSSTALTAMMADMVKAVLRNFLLVCYHQNTKAVPKK